MNRKLAIVILFMLVSFSVRADDDGYFVAYETLEMTMNKFQYLAGEVGRKYEPNKQVRLTVAEVNLSERHLSSSWEAYAVDGDNVEGYLRGYELNHDWFFHGGWYYSANIGYFHDHYEHRITKEEIDNKTLTVGSGIGYTTDDLFGVNGLYLNFSNPIRYYFNGIDETKLGNTTIREHRIVNHMWLFVGYKFQ